MNQLKKRANRQRHEQHGLSLHPLDVEDALRGAMQAGKPPEPVPQNKHAKRTATKRRLKGADGPPEKE
jgi:hypothetical protein